MDSPYESTVIDIVLSKNTYYAGAVHFYKGKTPLKIDDFWMRRCIEDIREGYVKDKLIIVAENTYLNEKKVMELCRINNFKLEIKSANSIISWIRKLSLSSHDTNVLFVIRNFTVELIKLLVENSNYLSIIEWRNLERIMNELFESLGYSVTLTRPSKDGGKDLILISKVENSFCSYIVEVKHWAEKKLGIKK